MSSALLREIAGPAGSLEALLDQPIDGPRAAAVFAHPHPSYGGTMHSRPVYETAKALAKIGVAVLRFNFRGVGASMGTHDGGIGEMDDYRAALDAMAARYPDLPLWAAGFSFGGWIAWNVGLDQPRVPLLLGLALPVNRFDFRAVSSSGKATFLVHGDRDEVVPARDIRRFYAELHEPKELVIIEGADHVFTGRAAEAADAAADLLVDWEG